jgi:WD40 repeat protein
LLVAVLQDVVLERVEHDLAAWAKTAAAGALMPEPLPTPAPTGRRASLQPAGAAAAATSAAAAKSGAAAGAGAASGAAAAAGAGAGAAAAAAPTAAAAGAGGASSAAAAADASKGGRVSRKRAGSAVDGDDEDDGEGGVGGKSDPDRIFNDDITDPDHLGRQLVKKALTLIECSRHGLQESELLELLAPRGKEVLPPIVWARLWRSVELYLHPLGEEENSMLGFFSTQMANAVRKRYLQNNRLREAEVCTRLADYFMRKADPGRNGSYTGESKRAAEDLVYYHLRALKIDVTRDILGSLVFIERRARRGGEQMELLLRDYHMAQEDIRNLKLSLLKAIMSRDDFARFSRAALLAWVQEYVVFVGSHHTMLTSYPTLTFQYAYNQPDISGPHAEAKRLLDGETGTLIDRMDKREQKAQNRAEAAIWALLCAQYHALLFRSGVIGVSPFTMLAPPLPGPVTALAPVVAPGPKAAPVEAEPSVPGTPGALPAIGAAKPRSAAFGSSSIRNTVQATPRGTRLLTPGQPGFGGRGSALGGPGGDGSDGGDAPPRHVYPVLDVASATALREKLASAHAVRATAEDANAWLSKCVREFGAPRPHLAPSIAAFLTEYFDLHWTTTALAAEAVLAGRGPLSPAGGIVGGGSAAPGGAQESAAATGAGSALGLRSASSRAGSQRSGSPAKASRHGSGGMASPGGSGGGSNERVLLGNVPAAAIAAMQAVAKGFGDALRAHKEYLAAAAVHEAETASAAAAKAAEAVGRGAGNPALVKAATAAAVAAAAAKASASAATAPPRSVCYMSRSEASYLGVPWSRLRQVRSVLAEDLLTLSTGLDARMVPRRFLEWVNKPQRNRIVADFAGLHSQVTCLCLSPDGAYVALGFKDSKIHLIDSGTGEVIRELTSHGHTEGITCLRFSGDGLRLASGSHDTTVGVWDPSTGTKLGTLVAHTGSVTASIWLDGDAGAAGTTAGGGRADGGPGAGAAKKGRRKGNRTLVSASMEGDIRITEERSRAARMSAADAGDGGETRYELIWSRDFMASPVLAIAYSSVTEYLVGAHGDGSCTVWDAHAPNLGLIELQNFMAHKFAGVMCVDFSPSGELLATGGTDSVLRLWRRHMIGTEFLWREEPCTQGERSGGGHSAQITSVHFSPGDGKGILTSSLDKKLILWDSETCSEILSMPGHADAVYAAAFLGAANRVVSGSYDKTVKVFDIGGVDDRKNSAPVKRATLAGLLGAGAAKGLHAMRKAKNILALSKPESARGDKDGDHGAEGEPEAASAPVAARTPASNTVGKSFFSETTSPVAGGAASAVANATAAGKAAALQKSRAMFGGRRVFGLRHALALEEANATGSHAPAGAHGDRVLSAVVSRDGSLAVTGAADKEIKVWEVAKGQEKCVLLGHSAAVTALCLTADCKYLFSGDASGSLLIWSGVTFDHLHTIQAHTSIAITAIGYVVVDEPPQPPAPATASAGTAGMAGAGGGFAAIAAAVIESPVSALSRGVVVFTGTSDGQMSAWHAETAGAWELQPPLLAGETVTRSAVKAIQFVGPSPTATPLSAAPYPINTGITADALTAVRRLEVGRRGRRNSILPMLGAAGSSSHSLLGGAGDDAAGKGGAAGRRGTSVGPLALGRPPFPAGGPGSTLGRTSALGGAAGRTSSLGIASFGGARRGASLPPHLSGSTGQLLPTPEDRSGAAGSSNFNMYRIHRHIRQPDPQPTVEGATPLHARPRLLVMASDGSLLVLDLFTMQPLHEEPAAPDLSLLAAAAISQDGTRVALGSALPSVKRAALVAPAAHLSKAVGALLESHGQRTIGGSAGKDSDRGRARKGDAGGGVGGRVAAALDPAEAKRIAEEKLKAELARLDAKKKRREERRVAKRAERQRVRAAAHAAAKAEGQEPEEEEEDDEDEDDDDESSASEADERGAGGEKGKGKGGRGKDGGADGTPGPSEDGDGDSAYDGHGLSEKTVASISLSHDGSLMAAGCCERLLTVVDASRPNRGPLAQFLTLGEVTAVAMGPGMSAWPTAATGFVDDRAWEVAAAAPAETAPAIPEKGKKGHRAAAAAAAAEAAAAAAAAAQREAEEDEYGRANSSNSSDSDDEGMDGDSDSEAPGATPTNASGVSAAGVSLGRRGRRRRRRASAIKLSAGADAAGAVGGDREHGGGSGKSWVEHISLRASRNGDGQGHCGVLIAGDSTGGVFILRLTDVIRCAEALRHAKAEEAERKRRAEAEAKAAREEEARRAEEEERRRLQTLEEALRPPMEKLHFTATGVTAVAALPPRAMASDQAADREMAIDVCRTFGLRFDELGAGGRSPTAMAAGVAGGGVVAAGSASAVPAVGSTGSQVAPTPTHSQGGKAAPTAAAPPAPVFADVLPPSDVELLMAYVGLGDPLVLNPAAAAAAAAGQDDAATGIAEGSGATDVAGGGPGAAAADKARSRSVAGPLSPGPRGSQGVRSRSVLGGRGGPRAFAALDATDPTAAAAAAMAALEAEGREREARAAALCADVFNRPRSLVAVFGGAGGLHDLLVPNLRRLIKRGAVTAAVMSGGMMLSGGTQAGVMEMLGSAFNGGDKRSIRMLGVSPAKLIIKPSDAVARANDANASPLEPHHSNFVLVPASEWGGETSTMFTFASVLAAKIPAVAVLANGGMISKREILNSVRHRIPVVVIEGSGRLADQIARTIRKRQESSAAPASGAGAGAGGGESGSTSPAEDPLKGITDPDLREIVTSGLVRLFNVTGHGDTLRTLLLDMITAQRELLRASMKPSRPVTGVPVSGAGGAAGAARA